MKRAILWTLLAAVSAAAQSPESRAVAYLSREVPRWSRENQCFSCHNNGDAARALLAAKKNGFSIAPHALADTTAWLIHPENWDHNRGNPAFSDKTLARIEFAAALAAAIETGAVHDRRPLIDAAASLLPSQDKNGSWQVDAGSDIGSPATYGAALATYMACRTLEQADTAHFADSITRANGWFSRLAPHNTLEAAAKLLALPQETDSLGLIVQAQSSDGGWGPRRYAPSEPFDTALVLLALGGANAAPAAVARGRAYLIATQQPSGEWPETTRPPGGQSYAERISTSGWATLALFSTYSGRKER